MISGSWLQAQCVLHGESSSCKQRIDWTQARFNGQKTDGRSLSLSLQLTWKEDEIFRCLKRRGYCKGSIKNPIHFFLGENMPWGGFKLQTVMKRYCTLLWIYCVLFWTYPWFSSPFQKKSGVTLHPNISAVQEHVFGSKGNSCNLAYSKVQARRGQGRHLF